MCVCVCVWLLAPCSHTPPTPYPRTRTHQVGKYEEKMNARETEVADGLARIEILTAEIDLQNQVRFVALPCSV